MLHISDPGPERVHFAAIDPDFDPTSLFRMLWRGKWLISAALLVSLLVAGYYLVVLATPTYTAHASVIREGEESSVIDFGGAFSDLGSGGDEIATEIEVIRSRGLVRRLVEEASLLEDPEFNARLDASGPSLKGRIRALVGLGETEPPSKERILTETIDAVLDAVNVWNVPDTNVFKISVDSASPEKAARLANALAELYIANELEVKFNATAQANEWLLGQVAALRADLESAERELKQFSTSSEVISSGTLVEMNRELKELRDSRAEARARMSASSDRIAALQQVAAGDIDTRAGSSGSAYRTREAEEYASAATGGATPARIAALTAGAEAEQSRAARLVAVLDSSIAKLEAAIERQSDELLKLQQIEREVEASRMIYEHALASQKELSVGRGIWRSGARVLSYAEVPTGPSDPNAKLVIALSMAIGALAGSGAVFIRESRQAVFHAGEEVERGTGLPVLGSVPLLSADRRRVLKDVLCGQSSAFSEAVRSLRTSLTITHAGGLPRVLSLTSCIPEAGKTTLALALAYSFSMVGNRVLVIDADLRRRTLSRELGLDGRKSGLAAAIAEEKPLSDVIVHNHDGDIDCLPAEEADYNPADLLSTENFGGLIAELKRQYDCIIVDTAPILLVPEGRMVASASDAVYLVVQWGETTRGQVRDALREFKASRQSISGTILSQVEPKKMKDFGYGDRREAQYAHGYYDSTV